MKYSFHSNELNNWKARITERLVECYINDVVVENLRKEGWDDVTFTPHTWFFEEELFENMELKFFIAHCLMPTKNFLNSFKKLTRLLENEPDGFLIKMHKTNETKCLKKIFQRNDLKNSYDWSFGRWRFRRQDHDKNEKFQIVDGEIEVVEVKCGKGYLAPNQKRSYRNILQEGYALRFFHVNIISFKNNEFEIEEKLITNPTELKSFPLKQKKN